MNLIFKSYKTTPTGRSERTRTSGFLVPNQARYQLRYTPENKDYYKTYFSKKQGHRLNFIFGIYHEI
jgi:hypothetical protein